MKLGRDFDYTHALNFLARVGIRELRSQGFSIQSLEMLEQELQLDATMGESLQNRWNDWQRGQVSPSPRSGEHRKTQANSPAPTALKEGARLAQYCQTCKSEREMKDFEKATFSNGRRGYRGTCVVCGRKLVKFGR